MKVDRPVHLLAVVVRGGRPVTLHDLGLAGPIARAVGEWRGRVERRSRPVQGKDDPAETLRRLLWAPLEKHLDGANTVLVSGDGPWADCLWERCQGRRRASICWRKSRWP